jgi:hypothetical protein
MASKEDWAMNSRRVTLSTLAACAVAITSTFAANALTAPQAKEHIGENATVCGVVASTRYAVRSNRQPTFLNFDQPYPHHIFTVVIWGSDRPKFGTPEVTLLGRQACVSGTIELYKSKPEIIVREPGQLVAR